MHDDRLTNSTPHTHRWAADHKFEKACELYSEAIKLHPTAILYANRAFAAIKMESYGVALADAEAALECVVVWCMYMCI